MLKQQFMVPTNAEKRKGINYMMIVPIGNMSYKVHPMDKYYTTKVNFATNQHHYDYFRIGQRDRHLPYHYLIQKVKGKWEVVLGCPLHLQSTFITAGVNSGYLPMTMERTLVVAVQDDFFLEPPEPEFLRLLASTIISPFMWIHRPPGRYQDRVLLFDEAFEWDNYERDMANDPLNNKYPYEVNRMKYFDRFIFNLACAKYML